MLLHLICSYIEMLLHLICSYIGCNNILYLPAKKLLYCGMEGVVLKLKVEQRQGISNHSVTCRRVGSSNSGVEDGWREGT
jgi:hypothetical protein